MCVISLLVVTLIVRLACQEVSVCASLSSQREQNYKRSPSSGGSLDMRIVPLHGGVWAYNAVTGGCGVRPALFSEGTELQAFAVHR